jgi:hypothetical protein
LDPRLLGDDIINITKNVIPAKAGIYKIGEIGVRPLFFSSVKGEYMKKLLTIGMIMAAIAFVPARANALILGVYNFDFPSTSVNSVVTGLDLDVTYGDNLLFPSVRLFDSLSIPPGTTAPQSYFATAASDSEFNTFAGFLTDGVDQFIGVSGDLVPSGSVTNLVEQESSHFGTSLFSLNGIDFAGYTITQVQLDLNQLLLDTSSGTSTQFSSTGSVIIHGIQQGASTTVPEPASMMLFGVGMAGFLLRRRNKSMR